MTDITFIGHMCFDEISHIDRETTIAPGSAVFCGAMAAARTEKKIAVIVRMNPDDALMNRSMEELGIDVTIVPAEETSYSCVIHFSDNPDERRLVLTKNAGFFEPGDIPELETKHIHLAGISDREFSLSFIKAMKRRGISLSTDMQSFVRQVDKKTGVIAFRDVQVKKEIAGLMDKLKLDIVEARLLTGYERLEEAAREIASWGVEEVVITEAQGVLVYTAGKSFYERFTNKSLIGRTGRGDTVFAAYLASRLDNPPEESLKFAAALVSMKMEALGPFSGTLEDVQKENETSYRQVKQGMMMDKIDIEKLINSMSMDQKLGQMAMAGICGGESLEFARRNFERYHFGGLMWSGVFQTFVRDKNFIPCGVSRNIPRPELIQIIHDIKRSSMEIDGIPVFMGGDQEGGLSGSILRRRGFTIFPKQMGLAASPDAEADTYQAAYITGTEWKAAGMDMLYSMSMDTNINPNNPEIGARAFSDDPQVCSKLGIQVLKALSDANVITMAKHFPGRGRGRVDAHFELEKIDIDRETLLNYDLLPFKQAIASGVESMMVCHSVFPAIDSELPASLSHKVITGLLREELGFEGLVVPDTLTMWAILKNYDIPKACSMTIEAGADMFFMKDPDRYDAVFEEIKRSIDKGWLTEERINQSVRRILRLKAEHEMFNQHLDTFESGKAIGTKVHHQKAKGIAQRSLTVINDNDLVPIPRESSILTIVPRDITVIQTNDPDLSHDLLARRLRKQFDRVDHVVIDPQPTEIQMFETIARARSADVVVVGVYATGWTEGLSSAVERILDMDIPVVALLGNTPYIAATLPKKIKNIVCTYGEGPAQFDAFTEYMIGILTPEGKLPVSNCIV